MLDDFGRRIFLNIFFWVGAMVIDLRYVVSAIRLLRRGKERLLDVVFERATVFTFSSITPLLSRFVELLPPYLDNISIELWQFFLMKMKHGVLTN